MPENVILQTPESIKNFIWTKERMFLANDYHGNIKSQSLAKVIDGTIPVILSAPHAVNHTRRNGKPKSADVFTGSIALLLQKITDCSAIVLTRYEKDYSQRLKEFRARVKTTAAKNNVRYLIDLHGAAAERKYDIYLGTARGITMEDSLLQGIKQIFHANGFQKVADNILFTAESPETITHYAWNKVGLQSIQIEVNYSIRNPNGKMSLPLVKSLTEAIHFLKTSNR